MPQQELLKTVLEKLQRLGIECMVTGSMASSLQGEPRSTHDIDLVVNLREGDVEQLVRAFAEPDYYLDPASVDEAVQQCSMFNLIDPAEGDKVDFWLLTDDPFDRSRFARKSFEDVLGVSIPVSSPEDTILALRWAKMSGGSEKQFTDALRVYEVQFANLDRDYLESWASRLDLRELWNRLKREAIVI